MIFCACSSLSLDKAHAYGPLRVQFKAVPVHCLAVGHAFWGTRLRLGPIPSHHGRAFWGSWLWYTHSFQGAVFRGSGLTTHLCPTTNNSCNLYIHPLLSRFALLHMCIHIYICVKMYVCTYTTKCKCVHTYLYLHICVYFCIYIYIYIYRCKQIRSRNICMYIWVVVKIGVPFWVP